MDARRGEDWEYKGLDHNVNLLRDGSSFDVGTVRVEAALKISPGFGDK